jgi:hypothetical protein
VVDRVGLDAAEGAPAVPVGQDCRLQLIWTKGPLRSGERGHDGSGRRQKVPTVNIGLSELLADRLSITAEDGKAVLIGDGAFVGDVEELGRSHGGAELCDQYLDLERLHLVGEDIAEVLCVEIGQAASIDVLAAVGEALRVGMADACDTELVVLVVLPDPGEGDPVVDLRDLVKRARWVLGDQDHALCIERGDEGAATGDALLGVLSTVLHDLLRCHVVRHAHRSVPPASPRRSRRRSMTVS